MWPTRGLGQPFLWATRGIGRGELVEPESLRGSSQSTSQAVGRLERVGTPNRGGGQSNADGPPRPFRQKSLRGSAESVSSARGRLTKVKDLAGASVSGSDAIGEIQKVLPLVGTATTATDTRALLLPNRLVGSSPVKTEARGSLGRCDENEILELLLLDA